jgi:hypothetical protein
MITDAVNSHPLWRHGLCLSRTALTAQFRLFVLARGDAHHLDGVADHVGRAVLAFGHQVTFEGYFKLGSK